MRCTFYFVMFFYEWKWLMCHQKRDYKTWEKLIEIKRASMKSGSKRKELKNGIWTTKEYHNIFSETSVIMTFGFVMRSWTIFTSFNPKRLDYRFNSWCKT